MQRYSLPHPLCWSVLSRLPPFSHSNGVPWIHPQIHNHPQRMPPYFLSYFLRSLSIPFQPSAAQRPCIWLTIPFRIRSYMRRMITPPTLLCCSSFYWRCSTALYDFLHAPCLYSDLWIRCTYYWLMSPTGLVIQRESQNSRWYAY